MRRSIVNPVFAVALALGGTRVCVADGGARAPVPAPEALAASEKIVRELFAADFAKHSAADRAALAQKLLSKVGDAKDDPAGSYVLLRDARELAVESRDFETALKASDRIGGAFEVDVLPMKTEVVMHAEAASLTVAQKAELLPEEHHLAEQLLMAGDAPQASRVAAQSQTLIRGSHDPALISAANQWYGGFLPAADVVARGQAAANKLKTSPDDPALCSAAGRFYCTVKGDWEAGLALLVKGSDQPLADLAKAELAAAAKPDGSALASAADGWAAYADAGPPVFQPQITSHAVRLYKTALPELGGLKKLAVQKRLAKLDNSPADNRVIDLLALVDPDRDALGDATWTKDKGDLVASSGGSPRIQVPYRPPEEYDFAIEYTRLSGDDAVLFLPVKGSTPFACNVGRGDKGQCWIGPVNHNWGFRSDAGGQVGPMPNGVRHRAVVKVRNDGVSVLVDDTLVCSWKTDYSDLSVLPAFHLNDSRLVGFGCYRSKVAFHRVSITEITGRGEVVSSSQGKSP